MKEINIDLFNKVINGNLEKLFTKKTRNNIKVLIDNALNVSLKKDVPLPTLMSDEFIYASCDQLGVDLNKLISNNKQQDILYARYILMYYLRNFYKMTFSDIGSIFNRDHTTIMNACTKANDLIFTNDVQFNTYLKKIESIYN
jgi:chromosomal replication initiation ATPase DnaA